MLIATDENFHHDIIRGLRRRLESLDILRVQDVLKEAEDVDLLEWAARENRVILSHDVTTLKRYADERVEQGLPMAGLVLVPQPFTMRTIIEDLLLLIECSSPGEMEGQVRFLPL